MFREEMARALSLFFYEVVETWKFLDAIVRANSTTFDGLYLRLLRARDLSAVLYRI